MRQMAHSRVTAQLEGHSPYSQGTAIPHRSAERNLPFDDGQSRQRRNREPEAETNLCERGISTPPYEVAAWRTQAFI